MTFQQAKNPEEALELITDCTIEDGNPPDSLLAVKMIVRHERIYAQPPM